MEAAQQLVAITGGSGRVGTALRRSISAKLKHVRVIDLVEPTELAPNESFIRADITDLEDITRALEGMDGVVHLAGLPSERPIEQILKINVLGASNLFEAARRARVPRVVLGSSNHVTGFYPRDVVVGPDAPMRPDGLYGLSKCWAELTAGLYYDKSGIRTLIIRIGNAQDRPTSPRALEIWLSPDDHAQLVLIGLTDPGIQVTTVFGASAGGGSWWDNSKAERLGYVPKDKIIDFAHPDALSPPPGNPDPIGEYFQGGSFCTLGHDGVLRRR